MKVAGFPTAPVSTRWNKFRQRAARSGAFFLDEPRIQIVRQSIVVAAVTNLKRSS